MKLGMLRSALVASCLMAPAVFFAGAAQAGVLAYTATASDVTAVSATLNGSIVSGGAATPWQFEYGLATEPFAASYTATATVPAGSPASVAVLANVTGLIPSTMYTFNLIANTGTVGSTTTPLGFVEGMPLTFTTKSAGHLSLTSKKLKVKGGRVAIGTKCASTIACGGTLTLTTRHGGKAVACATATFTTAAGAKRTFSTALSKKCKSWLGASTDGVLAAHATIVFTTYQPTISKSVTLNSAS